VTKASSGGFRRSRTSQKELLAAKSESTPTEAEYEVPLPLVEVGVSRLDKELNTDIFPGESFSTRI